MLSFWTSTELDSPVAVAGTEFFAHRAPICGSAECDADLVYAALSIERPVTVLSSMARAGGSSMSIRLSAPTGR